MRGNHSGQCRRRAYGRSIPACAGEPVAIQPSTPPDWGLSPRVRGNHGVIWVPNDGVIWRVPDDAERLRGLSPRVRGNHEHHAKEVANDRSIPACAGEPSTTWCRCCTTPVYPRVCGGTSTLATPHGRLLGLSPRVRGNRTDPQGSSARSSGLSPRVRGNRTGCPQARLLTWSIPACAGEPSTRVYNPGTSLGAGLSPRVRGNLHRDDAGLSEHRLLRSIPACAGEPPSSSLGRPWVRVYPRVPPSTRR